MAVKVAADKNGDIEKIFSEIEQQDIKAIVYFFSVDFSQKELHKQILKRFPKVKCVGASMIGGWSPSGPLEKGITMMSLSSEEIEDVFISFQEGVKENPKKAGQNLFKDIKTQIGSDLITPDKYIGIILVDGLALGEAVLKELTSAKHFTMPIVGGAAADDLEFKNTYVAYNGKQSNNAAALMVLKMKIPFYFNHYVHYVPTQEEFIVTLAEPDKRIIWEINNEPAAKFYANKLGLNSAEDINITHFSKNPLGVVIGGAVYTRSPNQVVDGKGLHFYCYIEAGTKMNLLKQSNIIKNANEALRDAKNYLGEIKGALLFNCVLRYLEMKEDHKLSDFAKVYSDFPFIGFNTYGEELFTHHNQTLTALFIGSR